MKIVKSFQNNALARQIFEGIMIREEEVDYFLNSQEEFHQPGEIVGSFGVMNAGEVQNGARYRFEVRGTSTSRR